MNQEIIANLEHLLAAVEAQPEPLFKLSNWKREESCGTIFCVAGLACTLPRFQELGMAWSEYDVPTCNRISMWENGGDELFGPRSMQELFHASGCGSLDTQLGMAWNEEDYEITMECSDKELAIARLKHRIANYKGE